MTTEILFVGDIHLGRAPLRVPALLADHGIDPTDLGPAAAWRTLVDRACRRGPAAVVLAGDVVESENARFEGYRHLRQGLDRLSAAGIAVFAVAGNHDVAVLPRLADELPGLHLLGRDGVWEYGDVCVDGAPVARLLGWSFPEQKVRSSPLRDLPTDPGEGPPVLGVLHCDLDATGGTYAPVSSADLRASHPRAWFLGHVHKPSLESASRPIGYLGSLVGLDPSETGLHGPWAVAVGPEGVESLEQMPWAPLRWESVEVAVGADAGEALDGDDGLLSLVLATIRDLDTRLDDELGETRVVGVRLRLVGTAPDPAALSRAVAAVTRDRPVEIRGDRVYFVDKITDETRPVRDLAALSRGKDPVAVLATDLLLLEAGVEDAHLLAAARRDLRRTADRGAFLSLAEWNPADGQVRDLLLRAGRKALEALLRQKEPVG